MGTTKSDRGKVAVNPTSTAGDRRSDLLVRRVFGSINQHATVRVHVDGNPPALSNSLAAYHVADQLSAISNASLRVVRRDTLHARLSSTRVIWITCSTTDLAFSRPTIENKFGSSPLRIADSMF